MKYHPPILFIVLLLISALSVAQNTLADEHSLYLRSHANDPVHWMSWDDAAERRLQSIRPVYISIGFSACHWCHEMQKDVYSDPEVAALLNEKFDCILIDSEERPDLDRIYQEASWLIHQRGGWPMNAICTPDMKPLTCFTYLTAEELREVLQSDAPKTVEGDTGHPADYIAEWNTVKFQPGHNPEPISTTSYFKSIREQLDKVHGGWNNKTKFPSHALLQFTLYHASVSGDKEASELVVNWLNAMMNGSFQDHVEGGFFRYATDEDWKHPHFEKILADNALLLSAYAKGYQLTGYPEYAELLMRQTHFMESHMLRKDGLYSSSISADSPDGEGRYYLLSMDEFNATITEQKEKFRNLFGLEMSEVDSGLYELYRKMNLAQFAKATGEDYTQAQIMEQAWIKRLQNLRKSKTSPLRDDKVVTSWNAMMINALTDAGRVMDNPYHIKAASVRMKLLLKKMRKPDGGLFHNLGSKGAYGEGLLEDYAWSIEACLNLYQATFDEHWLQEARKLAEYVLLNFNYGNQLLNYTPAGTGLTWTPVRDDLNINYPSSSAMLTRQLVILSGVTGSDEMMRVAVEMNASMDMQVRDGDAAACLWSIASQWVNYNFYDIAIVGKDCHKIRRKMDAYSVPDAFILGTEKQSDLPLLRGKVASTACDIYVCKKKSCLRPVYTAGAAYRAVTDNR